MATQKIAITVDEELLSRLDSFVSQRRFPNRSKAIQEALAEKLERMERRRLARELEKLDPLFEQELADEGLEEDFSTWPEY